MSQAACCILTILHAIYVGFVYYGVDVLLTFLFRQLNKNTKFASNG